MTRSAEARIKTGRRLRSGDVKLFGLEIQKGDVAVCGSLVERSRRMLLQCAQPLTAAELIDDENVREPYVHRRLRERLHYERSETRTLHQVTKFAACRAQAAR